MNEGHDDAMPANGNGGNNSAEQLQPEPQVGQSVASQPVGAQPVAEDPQESRPDLQNSQSAPQGPQGIFSSPDLAVNSENLEEIKPNLSEENKSRIASAFAGTDATKKHDQLSEQMAASAQDQDAISGTVIPAGGFGSNSGGAGGFGGNSTTSTATGDIRIPGAKKKSKLPLIFLALVVLAVAIGGVTWVMLGGQQQKTQVSLKTAFNNYANFFLYNTESNANLEGLYQYGDTYYIGTLNDEAQIDEHFAKSEEKYRNFLEVYKKYIEEHPDNNIDVNVAERIEPYYNNLDLVRYLSKAPNISANSLLEAFLEAPDGLSFQIDDYYKVFSESTVENTRNYGVEYKSQLQSLLVAYQTYNTEGCLVEGSISLECRQNSTNEHLQRANEALVKFSDFYSSMLNLYRQVSISIYEDIWVINLEIE